MNRDQKAAHILEGFCPPCAIELDRETRRCPCCGTKWSARPNEDGRMIVTAIGNGPSAIIPEVCLGRAEGDMQGHGGRIKIAGPIHIAPAWSLRQ